MKTVNGKDSVIKTQMVVTIFEDDTTYLFGNSENVDRTCLELINGIRELMDGLYPEPVNPDTQEVD